MKQYVDRIMRMSFSPEDIKFETDEQINAFHMALGRMVAYAMASDYERDIEVVSITIDKSHEITAAYWPGWSRGETYEQNAPQYALEESLRPFKMNTAFTMGAVPRDEGVRYSFHS